MAEFSLTKLPWYAQIGAFLALGIGGAVAFFILYEKPAQDEMLARQMQLKSLQADINKGQATARQLPQADCRETDGRGDLHRHHVRAPRQTDAGQARRETGDRHDSRGACEGRVAMRSLVFVSIVAISIASGATVHAGQAKPATGSTG